MDVGKLPRKPIRLWAVKPSGSPVAARSMLLSAGEPSTGHLTPSWLRCRFRGAKGVWTSAARPAFTKSPSLDGFADAGKSGLRDPGHGLADLRTS